MPESEDSLRRARKSGFNLFDRRQAMRSQGAPERDQPQRPYDLKLQPLSLEEARRERRLNSLRKGASHSNSEIHQSEFPQRTKPEKGRSAPFGWLLGQSSRKRDSTRKNAKSSHENRSNKRRLDDRRSALSSKMEPTAESSLLYRQRLERLNSYSSDNSASRNSSLGRSNLSFKDSPAQKRPSDLRLLSSNQGQSRAASEPASVTPISRRRTRSGSSVGKRGDATRFNARSQTSTRLQGDQPTLIQASTALQQSTFLEEDYPSQLGRDRLSSRRRKRSVSRPPSRGLAIALYAARMLILSVGVGVLAGTVLSAWNPASNPFLGEGTQTVKQATSLSKASPGKPVSSELTLTQEMAQLKTAIQSISQQYSGFSPGVFLVDLDTNNYVDWNATTSFSAASTIKFPILVAFFQAVDEGKIRLNEKLTMTKEVIAPEAGDMQYLPPGAQFTALETATKMMTISDNTATNMVIARLGGMTALNQRFQSWGLSTTVINNLLPDLKGTNATTPKELTGLFVRVSEGDLLSARSRDRMLDIMRRTLNNGQLPQGLGEGATIAHKTGDIATLIGDTGLIDMPNGKRYATTVLIKRGNNDDRAYELVQKISRAMYQHLNSAANSQPQSAPASNAPLPGGGTSETDAQQPPNVTPGPSQQNTPRPMQASTQ